MNQQNEHSEALFEQLNQTKQKQKQKKKRRIITVVSVIAVVLIAAVVILRSVVTSRFHDNDVEVLSYEATRSTISTTVSGTGMLSGVGLESIVLPNGVEVTEVTVRNGRSVSEGDVLATVNMTTVISTLSALQDELDVLDEEIGDAEGDKVSGTVKAGVSGRVKAVNAKSGDDVATVMVEHGALAVISLDGYMACELNSDILAAGDAVTVMHADGATLSGTVESAVNGVAVILVTDNGTDIDEEVTVADAEGNQLGSAKLYVHNPLSVTAVAGTVSSVNVKENAKVSSYSTLFNLKNTSYSANYETLLRERAELEESMLELLQVYRDGAVVAAFDGIISSVDYVDPDDDAYDETADVAIVSVYPSEKMSITVSVDESDILSLELGQDASVTVNSISDSAFTGTVTEVNKEADTSSGVAQYSAEVEIDYQTGMLIGMTAETVINIEGVENAIIIPADAVHQTSDISYVYTSYDEKTQQYGGMVEVVTGLSNDNYVEIISGLEEGTVVYYTESEDNFFSMMGGMNFGGNNMGSGGEMPSGGNMPSGGGMPSGGNMPSGGGMPSGGRGMGG
ncbi:MAG: HlyD family efflux transporter periplasmic adaptor subunit [Oscillospiraceae bacterium]|nr:HlyD family efflux transporter periplasmic adaptor subunit [Oscillospiraceae bacterium]